MLIDIDGNQVETAVVSGQWLFFSRSFKIEHQQPNWIGLFIEEIAKTNDLYLKEVAKPSPSRVLLLSSKKGSFQSLPENLKQKLNLAAEELLYTEKIDFSPGLERLFDLPGVSLASLVGLSLVQLPDSLNLLPVQIKETARLKIRTKERLQLAGACLSILLMFALGMWRSLENKSRYLEKLKLQLSKVSQQARPLEEIEKRFQVIERYSKKGSSCLDVLYELYKNIPPPISLVSFTYEDNGVLTIHGQAPDLAGVFSLVDQLEKAPAFKAYHIKVRYTTKKTTASGEVIDFEIVC